MNKKSIFKDGANKNLTHPKTQKGITLIALIITIIVLLILAVVAIGAVQNEGIIEYAKNARDDYKKAQDEEKAMFQNYFNVISEETQTEADGEEYEAISVETDCVKYYADVDGDKSPEGIIYIDKAKTVSGSWEVHGYIYSYTITNVTTGLKEYYISKESHTTTEFGTAPVLSLVPGSTGEERFYVMALEDVNKGRDYCWYYAASDSRISDYATVTGTGIGAGKTNTETMVAKWNSGAYGAKNNGTALDMWGVVEKGWYIPSKDEWSAFCSIFSVTSENYFGFGLGGQWTSSLMGTETVWALDSEVNVIPEPHVEFSLEAWSVGDSKSVRLGATF